MWPPSCALPCAAQSSPAPSQPSPALPPPLTLPSAHPLLQSIVRWNSAGDGFEITNTKDFAACVLPKYYRHNNYSTFLRSLSYYQFTRVRGDNTSCEYSHIYLDRRNPVKAALVRLKCIPRSC